MAAVMIPGDDALMKRIARGDEEAFRMLAERHMGLILRLAENMLGKRSEADDVAQEALVRIWKNAASFRADRARLTTWIYTIVYRLCLDRLRLPPALPIDAAFDVPDPAPLASDRLAADEETERLRAALRQLDPRQRAALTLFYYDDLSGPEAAEVLGLGLRAFWSLLHRARQSLLRRMDEGDALSTGAAL